MLENTEGAIKMENPDKLETQGTQYEDKQNKTTTQYVLDTTQTNTNRLCFGRNKCDISICFHFCIAKIACQICFFHLRGERANHYSANAVCTNTMITVSQTLNLKVTLVYL